MSRISKTEILESDDIPAEELLGLPLLMQRYLGTLPEHRRRLSESLKVCRPSQLIATCDHHFNNKNSFQALRLRLRDLGRLSHIPIDHASACLLQHLDYAPFIAHSYVSCRHTRFSKSDHLFTTACASTSTPRHRHLPTKMASHKQSSTWHMYARRGHM